MSAAQRKQRAAFPLIPADTLLARRSCRRSYLFSGSAGGTITTVFPDPGLPSFPGVPGIPSGPGAPGAPGGPGTGVGTTTVDDVEGTGTGVGCTTVFSHAARPSAANTAVETSNEFFIFIPLLMLPTRLRDTRWIKGTAPKKPGFVRPTLPTCAFEQSREYSMSS